MSFSLHSSTENFGGGRRSSSSGSNSSSSCSASEKSLIGEMSRNVSANPSFKNHSKLSRWIAMRSGSSSGSDRLANEYRSRDTEREATVTPREQYEAGWRAPSPGQRGSGKRDARQRTILAGGHDDVNRQRLQCALGRTGRP